KPRRPDDDADATRQGVEGPLLDGLRGREVHQHVRGPDQGFRQGARHRDPVWCKPEELPDVTPGRAPGDGPGKLEFAAGPAAPGDVAPRPAAPPGDAPTNRHVFLPSPAGADCFSAPRLVSVAVVRCAWARWGRGSGSSDSPLRAPGCDPAVVILLSSLADRPIGIRQRVEQTTFRNQGKRDL